MSDLEVRAARADDAAAVAEIWEQGWRDGHLGNVPAALVALRTPESFATRAADRVADTTVATVAGEVAGFVMVVADEVEQVYVSARHRGSGIANTLLAEAERQGWVDEGRFDYRAGGMTVPCHRYVKPVG